jgi:hypothetical protein
MRVMFSSRGLESRLGEIVIDMVVRLVIAASADEPQQGREAGAQVAVGENVGHQPEDAQSGEPSLHAGG